MKNLNFCLLLLFIGLINNSIFAQDSTNIYTHKSIPIENVIGNNRQFFQIIVNKSLSEKNQNGILSISSFASDYKKDFSNNEYLTTVVFYQKIYKGLSINSGTTFNSQSGLRNFIGLQYFYEGKNLSFLYLPSYYLTNSQMFSNLAFIEYKPKISKQWSLYSRCQASYSYDFENSGGHYRSYIYTRLGMSFQKYSFGLASNLDWYGKDKNIKENYGLFFTINL